MPLGGKIDEDDHSSRGSSSFTEEEPPERDEVKEVQKMSQKDNSRVYMWRFVMTGVLTLTAVAVTVTTYKVLSGEQASNFETTVSVNIDRQT
jgi:hypothetical protein